MKDYEDQVNLLQKELSERSIKVSTLESNLSEVKIHAKEKEMMESMLTEEINIRNKEVLFRCQIKLNSYRFPTTSKRCSMVPFVYIISF